MGFVAQVALHFDTLILLPPRNVTFSKTPAAALSVLMRLARNAISILAIFVCTCSIALAVTQRGGAFVGCCPWGSGDVWGKWSLLSPWTNSLTMSGAGLLPKPFARLGVVRAGAGAAAALRAKKRGSARLLLALYWLLITGGFIATTAHGFTPADDNALKTAVAKWRDSETDANDQYGDINEWDVSGVTSMAYMFA
jgi:hypothetical protein